EDRLEPLGRVEIADRAFREKGIALPLGEETVEIFAADDLTQLRRLFAAQVMREEVMRLLGRRETDLRMAAQIFGHGRRPTARCADDERPARCFIEARCESPRFQIRLPRCCPWRPSTAH